MTFRIDGKAIVDRYEGRKDRTKVSLYLSEELYRRFRKACGNAPASRVMEDLLEQFVKSVEETQSEERDNDE